jgi:hypothetical protein
VLLRLGGLERSGEAGVSGLSRARSARSVYRQCARYTFLLLSIKEGFVLFKGKICDGFGREPNLVVAVGGDHYIGRWCCLVHIYITLTRIVDQSSKELTSAQAYLSIFLIQTTLSQSLI